MRRVGRVLGALSIAVAGLFAVPGTAQAGLDSQMSLVDGSGRTMTIQQWDTFLQGVYPLDRNRLTREWFATGRTKFSVVGPEADAFKGTLELGYQVGAPWSLGVGLNFSYTTPNILLDDVSISPLGFDPLGSVITPNLFPGASISTDLSNGQGITEVATTSIDIEGAEGEVAVANAHGSITGVAGGVMLRPYARLVSSAGDIVTTYGEPWNMN